MYIYLCFVICFYASKDNLSDTYGTFSGPLAGAECTYCGKKKKKKSFYILYKIQLHADDLT